MPFTPPNALGPFQFPAPYHTRGTRLTNPGNAPQGCHPRMYPNCSLISAHRGQSYLYAIVGRVGMRPLLLTVNKADLTIINQRELPIEGEAENWYWSGTRPTAFYYVEGRSLRRHDVFDGRTTTVYSLDPRHGHHLWQAHSSVDDRVHSATVKNEQDENTHWVVYRDGTVVLTEARGPMGERDECQINASGRYLVIQEQGENRIIDGASGNERIISNQAGALAHLDAGVEYMVGEDDQHEPSALVRWSLGNPDEPRVVLHQTVWGPGMGHVSLRGNVILLSSNHTSELIYLSLDGSLQRQIAPGLIDGRDYDHQLRAALCPHGEFAIWIADIRGRLDALIVQLPVLGSAPPPPLPDTGGTVTPLETLKALRQGYPPSMTSAQCGELLNAVAWLHRAEGWGLLKKPSGTHTEQPVTRIPIAHDILTRGTEHWDVLISAGDPNGSRPVWTPKGPFDPARYVPPVDVTAKPPIDQPKPPPPTKPGGGDFPQAYPDENTWWHAVEREIQALYEQAGRIYKDGPPPDWEAFRWSNRMSYDIGRGMEKERAKALHLSGLRQALGL